MKTDLSESSFENDFAFENKNMRINIVDEDNTLMNLTNERGTKFVGEIEGIPIGVKKYSPNSALVFTTTNTGDDKVETLEYDADDSIQVSSTSDNVTVNFKDSIYDVSLDYKGNAAIKKLSEDMELGFSAYHPLEVEHYKDGDKDNFYLADGVNNFKSFIKEGDTIEGNDGLHYNATITGNEGIDFEFIEDNHGEFFSGVMVYCFSYVTKQGHKTGIIDTTDLIYLCKKQYSRHRYSNPEGLAPNSKWEYIVKLTINNLSNNFDKIELYSLYRSTLDGEITCRRYTCEIKGSSITFVDYNKGEICSYGELLTNFNSILIPSTMTHKNNVLFLGNITTNNFTNIKSLIPNSTKVSIIPYSTYKNNIGHIDTQAYNNALGNNDVLVGYDDKDYFLKDNKYFYGLQFQDKFGNWSPVVYLCKTSSVYDVSFGTDYIKLIKRHGYVAVRVMVSDDKRVRNTVCEGLLTPTLKMFLNDDDKPKYGIDYYSPYFIYDSQLNHDADIYGNSKEEQLYAQGNLSGTPKKKIDDNMRFVDLYSPDITYNENLNITYNSAFKIKTLPFPTNYIQLLKHKINVTINGNTAVLYNNSKEKNLGSAYYSDERKSYFWMDAIEGYQKALQLILHDGDREGDLGDKIFLSLSKLNNKHLTEKISRYKIYTWQPSGSLNDSKNKTSVLKYKQIYREYRCEFTDMYGRYDNASQWFANCFQYDETSNNILVEYMANKIEVYAGAVNQKIYPESWSIPSGLTYNYHGSEQMWDDNQIQLSEGYSPATMSSSSFVGQPIEIWRHIDNIARETWQYCALGKLFDDGFYINDYFKWFRDDRNSSLGATKHDYTPFSNIHPASGIIDQGILYADRVDFMHKMEAAQEADWAAPNRSDWYHFPVKVRITDNHNRDGNITMAYKTTKHLVANVSHSMAVGNRMFLLQYNSEQEYDITDSEIQNAHWIPCSQKFSLNMQHTRNIVDVEINECYSYPYWILKTEPWSFNDENQVTCLLNLYSIKSYINPICFYGNKVRDNGISSATFNKINLVYNQKNNFFIYSGFTNNTVTDDTMNRTMLYSDMKAENEKEDSWVNFNTTNFYTIDGYIKSINKLITFNDKLLVFSDDAIAQVLYNEKVVINTDSVQSLGLASTDKITGIQLITNSYGCLNKWSIGIYNNVLYFSDDINNKAFAYSGEFVSLYESLGIETYNKRLLKKRLWNPVDWLNTKLNVDAKTKDVHYTGIDIDIALNTMIGNFTSLYSYEAIPYIENIGDYSVAFSNNNETTEIYLLREGYYNMFWGKGKPKFEPYWTTVIMNQNSLVNKMMSSIDFSTEAYKGNGDILLSVQNFTFDHVTFWNDYQENKLAIDYKMYGQSLLKKKFRVWRINRFRDSSRMLRRNYDRMANTWNYLKLSSEIENNYKLTLHWLNINYL